VTGGQWFRLAVSVIAAAWALTAAVMWTHPVLSVFAFFQGGCLGALIAVQMLGRWFDEQLAGQS
jgi:hypothetical protein